MEKPKLIAALLVGFSAAFFFWYPISDGDIFWHLAAGRHIVNTHSVPQTDPFAFTSRELPWIDLHWLFQIGMFGIWGLLGLHGILIANSLFLGLAAGLLFFLYVPAQAVLFGASLWIAALFEIRYLAPHRPIMVSLFLLTAFIACLEAYGRRNRLRYLACLLPLQILWTNSQPLFLLGPATVLAWLVAEIAQSRLPGCSERQAAKRRVIPLTGALLLTCLASLANPYGPKAFGLAFLLFRRTRPSYDNLFSRVIGENRPLPALFGTPDSHYAWAVLTLAAFAFALMALRPRAVRLPLAFVAAGMGYLAFRAERNIILAFFTGLPLICAQLPAAMASLADRWPGLFRRLRLPAAIAAVSLAGLAVAVHASVLWQVRGSGPVSPFSFPDGSVAYLAAHQIAGNGFNADRYGGYLLWKRYPPRQVFIDTRYAIRPDAFLAEYGALLEDPERFRSACERYGITYAILPTAFVTTYLPLAASLLNDPEWRLAYTDGTEALFYKSGDAGSVPSGRSAGLDLSDEHVVDSLLQDIRSKWGKNRGLGDEAAGYFAQFLSRMGMVANADYVNRCIAGPPFRTGSP
ncbi:MAG: hypothetical protein JF616_16655 [Fibrobacteres bacterium]|jgi:hypothetical protein|nr:hypothetical protein [Fibrobacterota bacterium]